MDTANDKLSIKNLLFTKSIPNYEIPVPVSGHKIYPCTDCGDKFLFETSFEDHITRKTMLITYMCRYCNETKIFYNRCKLLFHIRSHTFKTATINVNDLKVEALPLSMYNIQPNEISSNTQVDKDVTSSTTRCIECSHQLSSVGSVNMNRVKHFMQYTAQVYACPVCLFTLPTVCGLRTHLRLHLKFPPYYCPECGTHLLNTNMQYPFNHDCEGFKMMRATARLKCPVEQCNLFHPNDFKDHMKLKHIKKVFKCPICVVACFNEAIMVKHLKAHPLMPDAKALIFYQCQLCPGRLVLQYHIETHLLTHVNAHVYPCWTCGAIFKQVFALLNHNVTKHDIFNQPIKEMLGLVTDFENQSGNLKRIYRVVKRCDQCKRNFTYKCKYNDIAVLPNECPYKCTSKLKSSTATEEVEEQITCTMCKEKISSDWNEIKKHFAAAHKNYRCLDPKLVVPRIDVKKYTMASKKKSMRRERSKRRQAVKNKNDEPQTTTSSITVSNKSGHGCGLCNETCETKQMLEEHMKNHRDPCMAYQCKECGQSFAVKPSFSKHLLLEHGVSEVEEYITTKECFNGDAFEKHQINDLPTEPLKENQCRICRDQFDNPEDLEKHFRVHGMAFLLKNTSGKSP